MFPNDNLDNNNEAPTPTQQSNNWTQSSQPATSFETQPAQPSSFQAQTNQTNNTSSIGSPGVPASPSKPSNKKRKILVGCLIATFLMVGLLSYLFLLYIPSRPENVYATAMDRSGRGLEKVINQVTTKSEVDRFKKGEYAGTIKVDFDPVKVDGTANLKYDNSKLDFKTDVKLTEDGQKEQNYKAQILTEIKEGSTYPDIYFILTGISDLGLEEFLPGINSLDSTWIKIEESYIKDTVEQYRSVLTSGGDTDVSSEAPDITSEDVEELGNVASSLIRDYVLTKDETKSIFVNKAFIAKEKIDDMNTYHYTVAINNENLKTACIESANRLFDSSAYKKLSQSSEEDVKNAKEDAKKSCEDDEPLEETFDMWVDAKYKLIYKIRQTNKDDPNQIIEFGQKYKGGDDLHFFVNYDDDTNKVKFNIDMNTQTLVSKSKLSITSEDESYKGKAEVTFDGKPLEGDITIDKPSNPKTLQQIIEELGLGSGEEALDPLGIDPTDEFLLDPGI